MTPGQQSLLAAITRALEADARVESAWLGGSLGKGQGDAWSDLDIVAVAAPDALKAILADLAKDHSAIAETIYANVLFGRLLNAITADFQRFDLFFITPDELRTRDPAPLTPLFNRTDTNPSGAPTPRTQRDVRALALEFLRVLALAPVAFNRGEWLVCVEGVDHLRRMAIDLMLEESRAAPEDRGGALYLNRFLTAEQRAALEAIPPLAANAESVNANNEAWARLFLPRAKALCAARGVVYPDAFETAIRAHLARTIQQAI